jgi:DNA-binding YbaB/EbfC family protein
VPSPESPVPAQPDRPDVVEAAEQPEIADVADMTGGFDLGALLAGAQEMVAAQAQAAQQEVIGSAGGGAVEVQVTGGGDFLEVRIRPDVVDPADIAMLEDLVLVAIRDAMGKVQQLQSGAMGGLDLGSLGGLLGGQP